MSEGKGRNNLRKLGREIKRRSICLMDRESFTESIMRHLKTSLGCAVTAVVHASDTGLDLCGGILLGFSPERVNAFFNNDHGKLAVYKDLFDGARRHGYHCMFFNDAEKNAKPIFDELYKPFGLTCGAKIVFSDAAGSVIGAYTLSRETGPDFSDAEKELIQDIAPYVFFAFRRYRWLVALDFFGVIRHDELMYGMLITDDSGRVTYQNDAARFLLKSKEGDTVPMPLLGVSGRLEAASNSADKHTFNFRELEAYKPPIGGVTAYRFDEAHGNGRLPVSGSGWVYLLNPCHKDEREKSLLTKRELEVIRCIGRGLQDKEIALALNISEKTVQAFVQKIYKKLNTENRTEAAMKAIRLGLQ